MTCSGIYLIAKRFPTRYVLTLLCHSVTRSGIYLITKRFPTRYVLTLLCHSVTRSGMNLIAKRFFLQGMYLRYSATQ